MDQYLNQQEIQWLFQALWKVRFFANVTLETIDKIVARFIKKEFAKGVKIIKEGTNGEAFYIIKSGSCQVFKKQGLFFKKELAVLKEGDFFGEMSLVLDDKTSASVKTLEPTVLFVLLRNAFLKILKENKELEQEITFFANKGNFEILKN